MSDKLALKCQELGVTEDAFKYTRKALKKAAESAKKANCAMEEDLTSLIGSAPEKVIKELRQSAEVLLIDTILKALIED